MSFYGYQPPRTEGTPIPPPRRYGNTDKTLLTAAETIVRHCKDKNGTCVGCIFRDSHNVCGFRVCPEEWRINEKA